MKRVGPGTLGYEIDRAQSVLTSATGTAPLFMRPRSGKIDAKARTAVQSRGLILVLWSIHPSDVQPSPSPKEIVRRATRGVRAGSIVLLHETNDNTVLALPGILAELRRRGLQPVTLSQLMSRSKP
jgi:peptidoglycan/xylan/chitin deacetylase (PgdA/CDA1 family)